MNDIIKTGMHLLVVVLFDDSSLEDIILGMTSISGGPITMIDGVSGSANLSQAIPMFAEFANMGGRRFSKILITCVAKPDTVESLIEALDEGGIDFAGSEMGEIYDIPLGQAFVTEG
ncbi:hypothetical protein LLG96_15195 [bacterium]|nr:hypothetical protein [bacterium]